MSVAYTLPFGASLAAAVLGAGLLAAVTVARLAARLLRRRWRPAPLLRSVALVLLFPGLLAATFTARWKGATLGLAATDLAMTQAARPPTGWRAEVVPPAQYLLLAGDLHCHINPPDWSDHVARHLPETLRLAHEEGLDFVSLVPHVFSGFDATPDGRARIGALVSELQATVDALPKDPLILDVGIEYIDPSGHFGMVFGDVPAALAATAPSAAALATTAPSATAPAATTEAFVAAFADRGGLLVVNHPLLTPTGSWLPLTSLDISWQPFTGQPPFRPEIAAVDARADGFEVANLFVREVRDRFLLGDREDSTRRALARLDHEILARGRRLTPVGGSDSHGFHLRPMTFVLAEQRSRAGIRDAIRAGRTCVLAPAACTLEVRAAGTERFLPVGASITGTARVEARTGGRDVVIYRNGEPVAGPNPSRPVVIDVPPSECSVLRAVVDGGYSAPLYVNCPFAG
jgi:hypothetical protein